MSAGPNFEVADDHGSRELRGAIADLEAARAAVIEVTHSLAGAGSDTVIRSTLTVVLGETGRPLSPSRPGRGPDRQSARTPWAVSQSEEAAPPGGGGRLCHLRSRQRGPRLSLERGGRADEGDSADEIVGCHFRIFYPAELHELHRPEQQLSLALRNGRHEEEGWRIRKNGTRFWAHVVITPRFDEAGQQVGFMKMICDRTERRLVEQARAPTQDG